MAGHPPSSQRTICAANLNLNHAIVGAPALLNCYLHNHNKALNSLVAL